MQNYNNGVTPRARSYPKFCEVSPSYQVSYCGIWIAKPHWRPASRIAQLVKISLAASPMKLYYFRHSHQHWHIWQETKGLHFSTFIMWNLWNKFNLFRQPLRRPKIFYWHTVTQYTVIAHTAKQREAIIWPSRNESSLPLLLWFKQAFHSC